MQAQLSEFHPVVAEWFAGVFGDATAPQREAWPAICAGKHALIAAPTGAGKTLAAFMAALDRLYREALAQSLQDRTRVLYVSPLKALSNDVNANLLRPLAGIRSAFERHGLPIAEVTSAVRTGDTRAALRQRMSRRPPHILVTTPESFFLLLTSDSGREMLRSVRTLILDEIHALAGNRRGSHLALSVERLAELTGEKLQRIGLSATQKPVETVARFLVGCSDHARGSPNCHIVDHGHRRAIELRIETLSSPLEAVMSAEAWEEIYQRLAEIIRANRTTLIFVNTRRLAERLTHHLAGRLDPASVTSHHGSLSTKIRHEAECRLKQGQLRALVATASLELGIDIGGIDVVCQIGSPLAIARLLQRVGRSGHQRGAVSVGHLLPLSRDDLLECTALCDAVHQGNLEQIELEQAPLDVLAQQIVACAASEEWSLARLHRLCQNAYPYRQLSEGQLERVVHMLAEGFSTRRGRRGAHIYYDAINRRLRGRRGARLAALTSGGAIPTNADYRVELDPEGLFIGTLNEDFAIESMPGDIFQLGSSAWQILKINAGTVRVRDARGQPPNMPFWLGEAPARSDELSAAVSQLRAQLDVLLADAGDAGAVDWLIGGHARLNRSAAQQLVEYARAIRHSLGVIPNQKQLVIERFFDEAGGMQLVLHSPFGGRINRAWGLALRKRFCRSFNFELQAAANEEAIVLSLGETHSFALEDVFRYLHPDSVREVLVQALLDSPMFQTRWRWVTNRALAVLRFRGGRRVPANIQRMDAEDLMSVVFPDGLACLENIAGEREVPDHPLIQQTIEDCLCEAMDVEGLIKVLRGIADGAISCIARDLSEPSPAADEILNARPYAFLDDAPLEERRTRAVALRRNLETDDGRELGRLDPAAIAQVIEHAWPRCDSEDDAHDTLLLVGLLAQVEVEARAETARAWPQWLGSLRRQGRAVALEVDGQRYWCAAERLPLVRSVLGERTSYPLLAIPPREASRQWTIDDAQAELLRGQLEVSGPTTVAQLTRQLPLAAIQVEQGLARLESQGFVLRGRFIPDEAHEQWCERRLLARIHRRTLNRLRSEIEAVSAADFYRFLLHWQGLGQTTNGPQGLAAVLQQLDGFELPAAAWEADILPIRVANYTPAWLDQLCQSGQVSWLRLGRPQRPSGQVASGPLRSTPLALCTRGKLPDWLSLAEASPVDGPYSAEARRALEALQDRGALFFDELLRSTGLLRSQLEAAIAELVADGRCTADSFAGLRALLTPAHKRRPRPHRPRRPQTAGLVDGLAAAGRWSRIAKADAEAGAFDPEQSDPSAAGWGMENGAAIESLARTLLHRYGVVFRRLLERETISVPWRDLARIYRRLEARGEIRGGYFVKGFSGEHFALAEALAPLKKARQRRDAGLGTFSISAADPLNLCGILTPSARVPAIANNRILFQDGLPAAALIAGKARSLRAEAKTLAPADRKLLWRSGKPRSAAGAQPAEAAPLAGRTG